MDASGLPQAAHCLWLVLILASAARALSKLLLRFMTRTKPLKRITASLDLTWFVVE